MSQIEGCQRGRKNLIHGDVYCGPLGGHRFRVKERVSKKKSERDGADHKPNQGSRHCSLFSTKNLNL